MAENEEKEYMERVRDIIMKGNIAVALGLAKDLGIIKILKESELPLSSLEIAEKTKLKERYVRELLGCLSSAKVISISGTTEGKFVYFFDEVARKVMTGPHMYASIRFPLVLNKAMEYVLPCIPSDGPYGSRYCEDVHNILGEMSYHSSGLHLDLILKSVPGLEKSLNEGIDVIEFGCGSGQLLSLFAKKFPQSKFTASELYQDLVDKLKLKWKNVPNMNFTVYDLCNLPDKPTQKYDWVFSVNVIHDLPFPLKALQGIKHILKSPTGVLTFWDMAGTGSQLKDVGDIAASNLYAMSTFLCIPESFQQKDSLAYGACWGKQTAIDLATKAGFSVKAVDVESEAVYICSLT